MITLPAIIDGLSLTLLHFLWQGTVIGIVAFILHHLLARTSPRIRYAAQMSLLIIMIPSAIATAAYTWPNQSNAVAQVQAHIPTPIAPEIASTLPQQSEVLTESSTLSHAPNPTKAAEETTANTATPIPIQTTPAATIPWAKIREWTVYAYAAGVFAMMLRLLFGMYGGQRLRSRSTAINEEAILHGLAAAAGRVGTRFTPAIAYCAHITAPTVVGLLRPMILVPLSFTNGLSPQQIEMILAHELAHIRRYDHWANLFQRLSEALLFFHPAVWYISSLIRHERELCCDDIVIATGGERLSYADSLVRVAEAAGKPPALGLSASGADKNLRTRVLRLIEGSEPVRLRMGRAVVISLGLIFILGGGILFAQAQQVDEPVVSESQLEPQATPSLEPSPEPILLAQVQEPNDEPSETEAVRAQQDRQATATRFTSFELTPSTNLDMPEPDLFSSCHEIEFDDGKPAQSFSQPGKAAAVSFRILHYLPPDLEALDLPGSGPAGLVGFRIFGQRYGNDYDPNLAPFIVTIQGDDKILAEEPFPYSAFDEEPGWADIVLPDILGLGALHTHRALTISIDPNNTVDRGLRIFASAQTEEPNTVYRARVGTVENGFDPIPESGEWMMRLYIGKAIAPIARLQEAAPLYERIVPSTRARSNPSITEDAVEIYKHVLTEYPQSSVALDAAYMLAYAYRETKNFSEAIAIIHKEIDPRIENREREQGFARVMEAHNWKELGDLAKAIAAYESALNAPETKYRYWRPNMMPEYMRDEIERLTEELRTQRVQSLLGMISEGDEPARAETTEAARARYEALLAEENIEEAFIALNQWIATLSIEEGRDRQTYLPFYEHVVSSGLGQAESNGLGASPLQRLTNPDAWINNAHRALLNNSEWPDSFHLWRFFEMLAASEEHNGQGQDALQVLSKAINEYPDTDYDRPHEQSYFHTLVAGVFRLRADVSFEEAESELLKTYMADPRFNYVPLESLRQSYDNAVAPERYLRLVRAVIELTSEKLESAPNNEQLRTYLQEYKALLQKAEVTAK